MTDVATPAVAVDDGRRRWILIATIIGSSMKVIDGTVVNIALPTIGRDLDAGLAAQQWIMLSYSLAVASLYIVAGALGDRYGRWPLFVGGVAGFAVASALAGAAQSTEMLVAARVLQGVAGAMLTTNSLALLRATYAEDSGRAVGLWTAWSGIGTMLGPPLGGLLVQYASWEWIFFINLPGAVLALVLAFAGRSPERLPEHPRPVQVFGSATIAITFGTLTYGLIEGAQAGFGTVLWAFGLSAVGLVLLAVSERRSANPLLPLDLLRSRVFRVANIYTWLVYAALGGATFYLALYLQSAAVGYEPARASLIFLPISLVMFFLAPRFGKLADRDGPRRWLIWAPLVMSVGLLLLTIVTDTNPLLPLPGVLVFALGLAMLVAPITATALKAAPDRYAGLAAGVNTTVSRLGGLMATPLIGVVITLVFASASPHPNADPFATHVVSADQRDATVTAFRAGMGVAVALCVAGSLLAARGLRRDDR
ncbi:MAG TPA: MFS transporter [Gaiellales bacterium]|nr:MFS transporter [Gaiellales bacterium]